MNGLVSVVTSAAKLYIPLAELVDLDAERARMAKEIEQGGEVSRRYREEALQ